MATESPLLHDGAQCVLSTAQDARRSSLTGSTLAGPNGSGQFLAVTLSTLATARTVTIASTLASAAGSTIAQCYGILQNTPKGGEAADVGIFGISKMVAGSTAIVCGTQLGMSSTVSGVIVPYSTGSGTRIGVALESVSAVGAVFTGALFGFAFGGAST